MDTAKTEAAGLGTRTAQGISGKVDFTDTAGATQDNPATHERTERIFPEAWDDPTPFDEFEAPEIPARLLPGVFGKFAWALATATETPEAMAVMTIFGVIATACAKRFRVVPKSGWRESVNIYTLVALPPGNTKSAVFRECTVPLIEWEDEQALRLEPEIQRQRSEYKSKEKIIEGKRGRLTKEESPTKQQALLQEIADLEAELTEPPVLPQLFTNNVTPEALENACHEQGGRFGVLSDEAGVIETLTGLYTGGKANVDILLKGIDGGSVRVRRKDRNLKMNPILTFVLTVQPAVIQDMGEKKVFAGKGALERFLWVLPKSRLGYRNHRTAPVPEDVTAAYRQAVRHILDIPPLVVDGIENPRTLTLAPGALETWREFQSEIEIELRPQGRLALCQGWGGKICGFALRLAALMHVAQHGASVLEIDNAAMNSAVELAELLAEHAIAAYGLMGADQATEDARKVWDLIALQKHTSFIQRDATYAMRHRMDAERIKRALSVLTGRNLISEPRKDGPKTFRFDVNPRALVADSCVTH